MTCGFFVARLAARDENRYLASNWEQNISNEHIQKLFQNPIPMIIATVLLLIVLLFRYEIVAKA